MEGNHIYQFLSDPDDRSLSLSKEIVDDPSPCKTAGMSFQWKVCLFSDMNDRSLSLSKEILDDS